MKQSQIETLKKMRDSRQNNLLAVYAPYSAAARLTEMEIDVLSAAIAALEWVKCSDRLPTNGYFIGKEVLPNGQQFVDTYYAHNGEWYLDETDFKTAPTSGSLITKDFIAWRPLPTFEESE
jgi:hypothetical protein